MVGQTVSHYRVLDSLGAGGMGVVYKAEDLKLARLVALKFLAPDRTHDQSLVERFVREARTASALNHPSICTIYEVGEHEGLKFIAMELLEGEPLDRRIGGRPLGVTAVIDYSIQIADALDVAHAQGILHRDIKPANIYITARGRAKILDFGLAKLLEPSQGSDPDDEDVTRLATELLTTKPGTALGTIAYMSPEQARGDALDARTDLFSFGLVIYEMATGQRTFEGGTTAVVFDAILNREPRAPIELNANIPLSLERLIGKCLQKDPRQRYQSAGEIRLELEAIRRERESGVTKTRPVVGSAVPASSGSGWPSASGAAVAVAEARKAPRLGRYGSIAMAAIGVTTLGAAVLLLQRAERQTERAVQEIASPNPAVTAPALPASSDAPVPAGATAPTSGSGPAASQVTSVATTAHGVSPSAAALPPAAEGRQTAPSRGGRRGTEPPAAAAVAGPAAPSPAVDAAAELLRVAHAKFDARLYDQAFADLQTLVASHTSSSSAAAYLLMGSIRERQSRPDDAMAVYVELHSKFPSSEADAEGSFHNAELILRSRRSDREKAALEMFGSIASAHPASPFAPHALARQAALEERLRIRVMDESLGKPVPAELASYRRLVELYPSAPAAESAYQSLAKLYEAERRYDLAAAALFDLATRFPSNSVDAAWRAGELYADRLKDKERARSSYALVPPQSSRYRDAQRKLQPGS